MGFSREALIAALLFWVIGLGLQAWRSHVLLASYDQGIFQQVLWNSLRGHPFESTLSSQLSTNVIHGGEAPALGYARLGQHFTPTLLLWAPLLALIGAAALPLVQVTLITAAGLLLHRLASSGLPIRTANWITYGFFCGNALVGPTLGNFTDLCQLPFAVFALMLGLLERRSWLILTAALLIPLIREDTGILLVAVGLWMLLRERVRWPLAIALIAWGGGWMLVVTSQIMPLFSDDNSKRFMVENFGQYLTADKADGASSLSMVRQALGQPLTLLKELIDPPGQTILYLLGHALPFLFVPLISLDAWVLAGPSLLGLFLAQGSNDPLSITIRYTLLVVPGFSLGTVFWWQRRSVAPPGPRTRLAWGAALALSLMLTISSNPHRSLSFLIPDSVQPWVYSTPLAQWRHGQAAREVLSMIPADASVSANTNLVPLLARREVAVRYPYNTSYIDRHQVERSVDWIAIDLDWLERYAVAFRGDWKALQRIREDLPQQLDTFKVQALKDGVVVLQRDGAIQSNLHKAVSDRLQRPLPRDPRNR
jgi:uncharacterized membrane protein